MYRRLTFLALSFATTLCTAASLDEAKTALKSMGSFAASAADAMVVEGSAFRVPLSGADAAAQLYVLNGPDGSWHAVLLPKAGSALDAESLWPGMGQEVFGNAQVQPSAVVVSTAEREINTSAWPAALKSALADYGSGTLSVKKGANAFMKVTLGTGGALAQVKQAIGMGSGNGNSSGSITVSGSVGPELLAKLLSSAQGAKSDAALSYQLTARFPSATPAAFASLDKSGFFVTFPSTRIGIAGQGKSFTLSGQQAVSLALLGKTVDIANALSFQRSGSSYAIACQGSADAEANLIGTAAAGFSFRKITLGGELSSTQAPGRRKLKGFGMAVGAVVDVSGVGTLSADLEAELQGNKLTELAFYLSGVSGGGIKLGTLPGIQEIPGAREFSFTQLGLGVRPSDKQAFIYGDLAWASKGIKTQAAVLLGAKERALFFKAQGLTLRKLSPGLPAQVDAVALDNVMLAVSTGTLTNMAPSMLPSPVRKMMAEVGASSEGRVTFSNGLTLVTAFKPGDEAKLLGLGNAPIVLVGNVGGVFNGDPSFALYASLGNFTLPQSAQPSFIQPKSLAPQFFIIARDIKSKPALDLGVQLDTLVTLGRDKLDLGLSTYVTMGAAGAGVRATGTLQGDWRNPLGLQTLVFSNAVLGFGFSADGTTRLAVGGKLGIDGDSFDSQATIGLTPVGAPSYLGLSFKASTLTAETELKLMDIFIRSIASGPLADTLNDKDKKNLQALANGPTLLETAKKTIPIGLVKINDAQIYLATPGTPSDPALPAIKGTGIGVAGRLIFNNKELGQTQVFVTEAEGMRVAGEVADFDFGPLLALKGAKLDVRVPMPLQGIPSFMLKGSAKVLTTTEHLDVELGIAKIKFISKNDWGPMGHADIAAESHGKSLLQPTDFTLAMSGAADVKQGIRKQLAPAMTAAFEASGAEERRALAQAEADIVPLKANLAAVKASASKNKKSAESGIAAAQKNLDKWDKKLDDIDDDIDDLEDKIDDGKDDPAQWDKLPGWGVKLGALHTKRAGAKAAYLSAKAALRVAKDATQVTPIDMYPEVIEAQAPVTALQAEIDSLKATTAANDTMLKIAADIKSAAKAIPISVEEISMKDGSLAQAVKGKPQRFRLKLTLSLPGKKPLPLDTQLKINLLNPTATDFSSVARLIRDSIRDIDQLLKAQDGTHDDELKSRKRNSKRSAPRQPFRF